jgi:hypothetical protein
MLTEEKIKAFTQEGNKGKANRIYGEVLYPEFNKLITGVIKRSILNLQTYSMDDYRAEGHKFLYELMLDNHIDFSKNFKSYLFTSLKNHLASLSKRDYNRYAPNEDMENWVVDENTEQPEFDSDDFLKEYLNYLRRNKNEIYKKNDKRVILQTYINMLSNTSYRSDSVGDITERIEKELTNNFTHSKVKKIKYDLNYLF